MLSYEKLDELGSAALHRVCYVWEYLKMADKQ